jgi:hypothetical protein
VPHAGPAVEDRSRLYGMTVAYRLRYSLPEGTHVRILGIKRSISIHSCSKAQQQPFFAPSGRLLLF